MTPNSPDLPQEAAVLVALARLEGKVDAALAQHGQRLDDTQSDVHDHEKRLRELEGRSTVSPRQLWATTASVVLVIAAASPFLTRIFVVAS